MERLTKDMDRNVSLADECSMVAAIDFGTTYSGYAFSFKDAPELIRTSTDWGAELGATRYKTHTCVLTNNHNAFVAFGYDALNMYADDPDMSSTHHLFDRFKMQLYREEGISSKTTITSRSGRVVKAKYIISLCLHYLSNHIVTRLQKSTQKVINRKQIQWIVTVPAIWSESAKQLMRSAALQAGMIDTLTCDRLMLALEPEAASFWCKQLSLDSFTGGNMGSGKLIMPKGTKYMVLDCGGGTVDVTVHEAMTQNRVKEIYRATGGPWGGTTVDQAFVTLLTELLGDEFITKHRKLNPQDWLTLMVQFETKKRSYDPEKAKSLNISISYVLASAVRNAKKMELEEVIRRSQTEGISISQGCLKLQKAVVEKLFKTSVSQIINHAQDLLQEPNIRDSEYLFLVGGYSDCEYLQQRIKETFSSRLKVMIPQDAGMCIMKGAVLFGHKPDVVVSRIAKKTYGEVVMRRFIRGGHDPQKKITVDGKDMCDDIFRVWLNKNESVMAGESRTFISFPHHANSTTCATTIFSSDRDADEIIYVTEPGVDKIGQLMIKIPDVHLDKYKRHIKTHVYFGGTEIRVRLEDGVRAADGDSAETNIDFLCE